MVTSAADLPADIPNGKKTLFANGVSTVFINGKPTVINDLRKFKTSLPWLVIFLEAPFNEIALFSKDLFTIISFMPLSLELFLFQKLF